MLEKYGKPSNILQNTSLSDHSVKAKYEGSQTLSHLFIYLEEYYTKSICCFLFVQQIRTQLKCNLNFVKYKLFFFFSESSISSVRNTSSQLYHYLLLIFLSTLKGFTLKAFSIVCYSYMMKISYTGILLV